MEDKLLNEIDTMTTELLNNDNFKTECLNLINEIWKDKTINMADVPYFASLIVLIYYKNPIKQIKKENVKLVFKNLLTRLLKTTGILDTLNDEIKNMIDILITSALDIVFLNVSELAKSCLNCCKKAKKDAEYDSIIDHIKSSISKKLI